MARKRNLLKVQGPGLSAKALKSVEDHYSFLKATVTFLNKSPTSLHHPW